MMSSKSPPARRYQGSLPRIYRVLAKNFEGAVTDRDAIFREVVFGRKEFRESFHGQLLLAAR
jgi:hypothetical protein